MKNQIIKKFIYTTFFTAFILTTPFAQAKDTSTIVMGYWENWATYKNFPMPNNAKKQTNSVLSQQLTGINALAYSFLEINDDGTLLFSDIWSDLDPNSLQDKNFCAASPKSCPGFPQNAGLGNFTAFTKTPVAHHVISVGGAGHDTAWENAFTHPDQFVASLKAMVDTYQIDWLDIDYEPIGGVTTYKESFINLTNKIKQALPNLKISYSILANAHDIKNFGNTNWALLNKNLTYINIMGYDMHGAFDKDNPRTALHSALIADNNDFDDESTIKALNEAGIANNKIILGMPVYGRAVAGVQKSGLGELFTRSYKGDLDDPNCTTENLKAPNLCGGVIQYKTIVDQHYQATPVSINGLLSGVYAYDPTQQVFISYDSVDSAKAKAKYILDHQLAGTMFWALRFDKPIDDPQSIIAAVDSVLGITPTLAKMKLELTNNHPTHAITISLVTADKAHFYAFPSLTAQQSTMYTDLDSSIVRTVMNNDNLLVLLTPANGNPVWCNGKLNFTTGSYHHIQVYYDTPVPQCAIF